MSGEITEIQSNPLAHQSNHAEPTAPEESTPAAPYEAVAVVSITHPDFTLGPTLAETEATIRPEFGRAAPGRPLFVAVETDDPESFEAALATDSTIENPTLVDRTGESRTYVVEPRREETIFARMRTVDCRVVDVRSHHRGWLVELQLPTRPALGSFRDRVAGEEADFDIRRLQRAESVDFAEETTVTDRQQDVLLTAYDGGYFEVPRRCTQHDVAAAMDVSPNAVSQQVRRATKRLLETTDVVRA